MTKPHWALALLLTLPAYAQEEAPAEETVVVEPAAESGDTGESFSDYSEGESFSDYSEGESFSDVDQGESFSDAAAEEGESFGEAPAEDEPLAIYVGVDLVNSTLSTSSLNGFPGSEFDSSMYRLRAGVRALESVGLELHYGLDNAGDEADEVATDSYYGLYLVPTATVLETVELAFPVGYAMTTAASRTASADLESIAYGIDAELPLRTFGEGLPDFRLTAGWMVYYQQNDARLYGANFGLRYDFGSGGIGNPLAGLGHVADALWPFGDDAEAAAEEDAGLDEAPSE